VTTTFVVPQHGPGNIGVELSDDVLGVDVSTPFAVIQ
jgi:hypothetical protein